MIVVNFKNYKHGKDVLDLVRTIDIYCNKAMIAVPAIELKDIAQNTTLPVFAQNVGFIDSGKGTGLVSPESIAYAGATGSLLNHSENKSSLVNIKKIAERFNEMGLKLIICASTLKEAEKVKKLNPYAIAFEDPKLISSGNSITTHKANSLKKFVKMLEGTSIIPLCGAGISTADDVANALLLGCKGVLVSSAIANAQNPEKFLKEVAAMF